MFQREPEPAPGQPPGAGPRAEFDFTPTDIPGMLLVRPRPVSDDRGWFMRTFSAGEYAAMGIEQAAIVQENQSRSHHGVLRGLHSRAELREAKLIRVPRGEIFDVVVDLRPGSPTFLQWRGYVLNDADHLQVLVPAGCLHGFQTLSDVADVCYKVDAPYAPDLDVTVAWNDPDIGIEWPLSNPVVSERDRTAPGLADIREYLEKWYVR